MLGRLKPKRALYFLIVILVVLLMIGFNQSLELIDKAGGAAAMQGLPLWLAWPAYALLQIFQAGLLLLLLLLSMLGVEYLLEGGARE